jgi:cobalt-zinc-cadmium efflux system outer membrane protein
VQAVATLGPIRPLPERAYEPASANEEPPAPPKGRDRLQIPPELPGAEAGPLKLPAQLPKDEAERARAYRQIYPPLPPLGPELRPVPGATGRPLTLADLQQLALGNSPMLRRAADDVQAARGLALQAGLYPNPIVGYQADQVEPGTGPTTNSGQQGVYINQLIKTGKKLQLAQAAAGIDVLNAQVALRQAQADLNAQVRRGYFAVLVARESLLVARALTELTDATFRIQVRQVRGGQAAPYEPLQLYVFSIQARTVLEQARNRYMSAWKQLAAAMGLPEMPVTELAGQVSAPVPPFLYDAVLTRVLANHTSVQTAENTILKTRYDLRLEEVKRLPDLHTNTVFQHDNAAGNFQFNLQLGVSLPVFDRNQGNIQQARALVARAQEDLLVRRNDLVRLLAEAFERYQNTRVLVEEYRTKILPNQVRVYRGIRRRYEQEPQNITFADIITAQQNLSTTLATYLMLLGNQWQAVVDVANLLQSEDLYVPDHGPGGSLPDCLREEGGLPAALPAVLGAPEARIGFEEARLATVAGSGQP